MPEPNDARDAAFLSFMQEAAQQLAEGKAPAWQEALQTSAGTRSRTGAGRRAFSTPTDRTWDAQYSYPQIAPTNSIEPARPRTLAAGYDPTSRILMVTFRDGTAWQYYGVESTIWQQFQRDPSPGRFIRSVLDAYPNGRAPDMYQGIR